MGNKPTFRCWECERESGYLYPAEKRHAFVRAVTAFDDFEKRTYYCEYCETANEIELKESEWMIIEFQMRG